MPEDGKPFINFICDGCVYDKVALHIDSLTAEWLDVFTRRPFYGVCVTAERVMLKQGGEFVVPNEWIAVIRDS